VPAGIQVNRQWILVLKDGSIVIDWGDGMFQDVRSGDFSKFSEEEISHHIKDDELDWLKRIGRVEKYDTTQVFIFRLPERPQRTLD
jgi:hypothetical protein